MLLKNIPGDELMRKLEGNRKMGEMIILMRAMWNSMFAGVVFDHDRIETLIQQLKE